MAYSQEQILNKIPSSQRTAFKAKSQRIATSLGVPLYHLLAIMDVESGMSPSITNAYGYTGLIQFGDAAAKEMGTTTSYLRSLSAVSQLDYVEKYYKMWMSRLGLSKVDNFADLYLLVLYPAGVKIKNLDTPVMPYDTAQKQAKILRDSSGNITKNSITQGYALRYAGLLESAKLLSKMYWIYLVIGALLLAIAMFLIYNSFIRKKPLFQFLPDTILD
jgi:hypothetical protein